VGALGRDTTLKEEKACPLLGWVMINGPLSGAGKTALTSRP
jgi:hypothetical protein